ncbi:MAG: exodeoxyribonuclease V subunit alpha [Propionibacteriaceae bacterium]|nr:exodeoxyribonuclease V subunit alpha [Propionibacteriaceae bacterium]
MTRLEESGLIPAATVRLARHLGYLYGEDRDLVVAATACAITALSAGSVCFDLDHTDQWHVDADQDPSLAWPDPHEWAEALRTSPMVSTDLDARDRPVILHARSVYLTRYWIEQDRIVAWLRARVSRPDSPDSPEPPAEALDLFFPQDSSQRHAAELATTSKVCVVAGGPGTGKTTAVARILAVLAQGRQEPMRVILTAPTGRAAARLDQAVRANLASCQSIGTPLDIRCTSGTVHRVLGIKPWGGVDHDATRPLAADVVVADESSMLSLHLMSLLLDAIPEQTRLILVGDPDQLASVEAGAVLADIVACSQTVPVARLTKTYRFGGPIASLATAIRTSRVDDALDILSQGGDQLQWIDVDVDSPEALDESLSPLRQDVVEQGVAMVEAARVGDVDRALALLDSHRLLLAHRHGGSGVAHWTGVLRGWLAHGLDVDSLSRRWYPGMPVLVTRNDDVLSIYNGDSGVIVTHEGHLWLALNDGSGARLVAPDMITSWEPLYASTIHKAQGSQYDAVSLILPSTTAALLSRELFYTAVTRATSFLRVIGSADAVRQAIRSPALRASGLASRLTQPG